MLRFAAQRNCDLTPKTIHSQPCPLAIQTPTPTADLTPFSKMIARAPKTPILYYVAFVDRGAVRRIISLRRANREGLKHYVENIHAR